jgi:hypothetical protein
MAETVRKTGCSEKEVRRPELRKKQRKTVLPCVNLGKGPQGTRVGRPRLDIIRGHERDVFVDAERESGSWEREEELYRVIFMIIRCLARSPEQ